MFSDLPRRLLRDVSVRLSLFYSLVFVLSTAGLFSLAYVLLARTLERKDQEILQSRITEYAAIYTAGGLAALESAVNGERFRATPGLGEQRSLFVRLVNRRNDVTFASVPPDWITNMKDLPNDLEGYRRHVGVLRVPVDEEREVAIASTVLYDGSLLQVGRSTGNRSSILQPFRRIFASVAALVIVVGFGTGIVLSRRAMRPIRQIVATASSIIQTGRLDTRVPERQAGDELDDMVRLFNSMLDRNQALIHAMRESLDNVAHDLRTPLTRLRGTAELALQGPQDAVTLRESLADCVEESERVLSMLRAVMDVAEAEAGMMRLDRTPHDLATLLREIIELYDYVAEQKSIQVDLRVHEACQASVDPTRMRQVFANLLDNALKYTPIQGRVIISTRSEPGRALVQFQDNGMGIPLEEQEKIWSRLYRGDKSRSQRGLGLGLSMVKAIVEAHQGRVSVESQPSSGSTFTVELPAV